MEKTCNTCKSFLSTQGEQGECHHNPPTAFVVGMNAPKIQGAMPTPVTLAVWPPVRKSGYCHQHKPAIEDGATEPWSAARKPVWDGPTGCGHMADPADCCSWCAAQQRTLWERENGQG